MSPCHSGSYDPVSEIWYCHIACIFAIVETDDYSCPVRVNTINFTVAQSRVSGNSLGQGARVLLCTPDWVFFHFQAAILAGKEKAELEAAEKENTFRCTAKDIGIEVGARWFVGHVFYTVQG